MLNPVEQFILGPLTGELELERYVIRIGAPVDIVYQVIGGYGALRRILRMQPEFAERSPIEGSLMGYRFRFPAHEFMRKGDRIELNPLFKGLLIGLAVTKAEEGRRIRLKYTDGPLRGKLTWMLRSDPDSQNATELEFTAECSINDPLFRLVWLFFFQWVHYLVIGMMLLQIRRMSMKAAQRPAGDPVHG